MPISVCILINQWHPKLPDTLASYQNCCSEILLGINGGFKPEAYPELSQNSHLKLISLDWKGYGATKNELATHAANDWILSVDTDEVADSILQNSLSKLNPSGSNNIYAVGMCHHLGEKPVLHGSWKVGHRNFLRLYNRKYTSWDTATVHEQILKPSGSNVIRLQGRINHYTAIDYQHFLEKNKHYAKLSAKKYQEAGKAIFPGKSWLSFLFSLIKNYIFRLGFLDGKEGWQIAKGTALYTYWKYNTQEKARSH